MARFQSIQTPGHNSIIPSHGVGDKELEHILRTCYLTHNLVLDRPQLHELMSIVLQHLASDRIKPKDGR
jgi:hypothetical protein